MSEERSPFFYEVLQEMQEIHDRKNADYSGSDQPDPFRNFRMAEEFGVSAFKGIMVRISDKYMRLCNLIRTGENQVKDESLEDTLLDLANYAAIALAVRRMDRARTYVEPKAERHLAG